MQIIYGLILIMLTSCLAPQEELVLEETAAAAKANSYTVAEGSSFDSIDVYHEHEEEQSNLYSCYYDQSFNESVAYTHSCDELAQLEFNQITGTLSWIPDFDTVNGALHGVLQEEYEFLILANYNGVLQSNYFQVIVTDTNIAPQLAPQGKQAATENIALTLDVDTENASDLDDEGDALTYSCVHYDENDNATACVSFPDANGPTIDPDDGSFNWTPDYSITNEDQITHIIQVCAEDVYGASDCTSFEVDITNSNRGHSLAAGSLYHDASATSPIYLYQKDDMYQIDINTAETGNDLDQDGDSLVYDCYYDQVHDGSVTESSITRCSLINIDFDHFDGSINWNPPYSTIGDYELKITATDQRGQTSSLFLSLEVEETPVVGIKKIFTGNNHSCFLSSSDKAYCFGDNGQYQLSDGSSTDQTVPKFQENYPRSGHLFTQFALGSDHSCALDSTATAYCWGDNTYGQLGIGNTAAQDEPTVVDITNLGTNEKFKKISSFSQHNCALTNLGRVFCWGRSQHGQVGHNSYSFANAPTLVDFSSIAPLAIKDISVGPSHSCALDESGRVYCWGDNSSNQIDSTGTANFLTPTLNSSTEAIEMALGDGFTCLLRDTGNIQCVGSDANEAMGNNGGGNQSAYADVQLPDASSLIAQKISAGQDHLCALSEGDLYCWGENGNSQLGDGLTSDLDAATLLASPVGHFVDMDLGELHTCALTDTGKMYCWGDNTQGQAGNSTGVDHSTPQAIEESYFVKESIGIRQISAGGDHTCAVSDAFHIYCWGNENLIGQDLIPSNTSYLPIRTNRRDLTGMPKFTKVFTGDRHSCGLTSDAQIYCWGENSYGQLGDGSTTDSLIPVAVDFSTPTWTSVHFKTLALGQYHTCALSYEGGTYCWGRNNYGQLGEGTSINWPLPKDEVNSIGTYIQIESGDNHTCALASDGSLDCWGAGSYGEIGDGNEVLSLAPTGIDTTTFYSKKVAHISAGGSHTCATEAGERAYCWGLNSDGQLGDNSDDNRKIPRLIDTSATKLRTFNQIGAGGNFTCGLSQQKSLYCWGANSYGQLANASSSKSKVPQLTTHTFNNAENYVSVTSGRSHACALDIKGQVYCWGSNVNDATDSADNGKLGRNGVLYSDEARKIDSR